MFNDHCRPISYIIKTIGTVLIFKTKVPEKLSDIRTITTTKN